MTWNVLFYTFSHTVSTVDAQVFFLLFELAKNIPIRCLSTCWSLFLDGFASLTPHHHPAISSHTFYTEGPSPMDSLIQCSLLMPCVQISLHQQKSSLFQIIHFFFLFIFEIPPQFFGNVCERKSLIVPKSKKASQVTWKMVEKFKTRAG